MIFLYIFVCVLLILAMVLALRITIKTNFISNNGQTDFFLTLYVGFLKFALMPGRNKKVKTKDFSAKKFKSKLKKLKTTSQKPISKKSDTASQDKSKLSEFFDKFSMFKDIVLLIVESFKNRCKIVISKYCINVGSDDAAKTALIYAGVCSASDILLQTLLNNTKTTLKTPNLICVQPDFSGNTFSADISLKISISVLGSLLTVRKPIVMYIKKSLKQNGRTKL